MIIIPDIHGRTFWKNAVGGRENDEILFLGDYVDPYTSAEGIAQCEGMNMLLDIIEFKKQHMNNVILLLGNHDLSYVSNQFPKCRYDNKNADSIKKALTDNLPLFKIAHEKVIAGKRYIFTHAGILPHWWKKNEATLGQLKYENAVETLNSKFADGILYAALSDVSYFRGGHLKYGSCVWADLVEHLDYFANPGYTLTPSIYQVFGHTFLGDTLPIITSHFACLDCGTAFCLNDDGNILELV